MNLHSRSMPLAALLLAILTIPTSAEPLSERAILDGADQRIREHRMADVTISIVDAQGRPVPGASVTIEQTNHAFLFGCNMFRWADEGSQNRHPTLPPEQADYRRHFASLLNFATLGFYWPSYERAQGEPRHDYTQRAAEWCKEQGIATKGHPLAWNYADASWYPEEPEQLKRLQMKRIDDCVSRFRGLIDRWDVVNEATHFERDSFVKSAPRHTAMWKETGRIEFTRECFEHARKANPQATLLINDYRTDPAYEKLIEQLVDADDRPLYDVIGIQSHMHGGAWPTAKTWEVCERYARFGVPLHFTETTILSGERGWNGPSGKPWASTPEGEAYQAEHVVRLYTILFSHPAVEAITWWDFSDAGAWKGAPAGFLRADMTPKPAYEKLIALVKGKWWTKKQVTADASGKANERGFLGDYRVTVTAKGHKTVKSFTLQKGEANRWVITLGDEK